MRAEDGAGPAHLLDGVVERDCRDGTVELPRHRPHDLLDDFRRDEGPGGIVHHNHPGARAEASNAGQAQEERSLAGRPSGDDGDHFGQRQQVTLRSGAQCLREDDDDAPDAGSIPEGCQAVVEHPPACEAEEGFRHRAGQAFASPGGEHNCCGTRHVCGDI